MTVASAIETSGLAKTYGKTQALHPVSLAVPQGSIFALLGHNGAGKTTLIKLLVNIFRPSAGSATVLGRPSSQIAGDDFTSIGYVSENQDLPGWMTVRAFLQYQSGFYPNWDDASLIQRFELPLDRKLKHLSRGQRMKAALASVLAFRPSLIVLDEPFSGLDPLVRDELIEALLDTAASQPTTILLSSHDLAEIESFATHVAFLHNGSLLFSEEMPELSARFREITVTLAPAAEGEVAKGFATPATWLQLRHSAHTAHFIHTRADSEAVEQQVRDAFPSATAIDMEPMNLRSIFLAIAKSGRTVGTTEGGRL
jgi:ABC-2 type transport system ATP-binding protein